MVRQDRRPSNRNGSQGEQPPAASARTESPDGLEDIERVVRGGGPTSNQLLETLAEWEAELEALNAPELNDLGIEP